MSEVADGASHLVHPERSLESVMERLLALRAEIDAILARLPAPSADSSPADAVAAGISEETDASFAAAADNMETLAEAWETARPTAAARPTGEPKARSLDQAERDQPNLPSNMEARALAAGPDAERAELELFPRAEAAADLAVIEAVAREAGTVAAWPDKDEQRQSEVGAQMRAVGAPVAIGATRADETVSDAIFLNFLQVRQQKHKSADTTAPAPARSGGHLAAKIAAAILVLLTAAGVMMMADRAAFGGAAPLACMAPSPPPTVPGGLEWLWQRLRTGQARSQNAPAALADPRQPNEAPLANHAVAWGS
jgi:hypothetical protein